MVSPKMYCDELEDQPFYHAQPDKKDQNPETHGHSGLDEQIRHDLRLKSLEDELFDSGSEAKSKDNVPQLQSACI